MKSTKIAFVGGDRRMFECAERLSEHGLECALYGFEKISDRASSTRCYGLRDCIMNSSAVILPLPVTRDGVHVNSDGASALLTEVFESISPEIPMFAGMVSEKVRSMAEMHGHGIYDYFDNESLTLKNALATAEGAIYLAMKSSDSMLFGASCLVTGYGRIGRYTAGLLKAFGADVTVYARREEARTCAMLDGFGTLDLESFAANIGKFGLIFNTVPSNIFSGKVLANMLSSQVYIELASAPFGVNKSLAASHNIEITDGAGLPSRYCPKSAGGFIAEGILPELERMGII